MSLIKTQSPANIHSVFIPTHYTYQTDITYESNFRFKYWLRDIDGTFFEGLTVPLENNLSYNTPAEIIKSKTEFNFNPAIKYIENIPNNCLVYQEQISEDYTGGDTDGYYTKTALRYSDTNFIPTDNFIADSAESEFLVNMPIQHNIRINDDFTFRTYNGHLDVINNSYEGRVYSYKMELHGNDLDEASYMVTDVKVESMINPYWNSSSSNDYNPTTNGDDYNIEIPAGPNNWVNTSFRIRSFVNSEGVTINTNQTLIYLYGNGETNTFWFAYGGNWYHLHLVDYDFYIYTWPSGTNGQISVKHNFKLIDDCKFNSINVGWENTKGGVDYYLFTKANEKNIATKKDIYQQNIHTLNLTDQSVKKNAYNKGYNVYSNNVSTYYELHTDWLNQDEINGMEDLFHSTEVYMNINNKWVFVISVDKKATIYNKKRKGLKKYKLNFMIGENKIRY